MLPFTIVPYTMLIPSTKILIYSKFINRFWSQIIESWEMLSLLSLQQITCKFNGVNFFFSCIPYHQKTSPNRHSHKCLSFAHTQTLTLLSTEQSYCTSLYLYFVAILPNWFVFHCQMLILDEFEFGSLWIRLNSFWTG